MARLRKHPMECVVWATEQAKCCATDTDIDDENAQDEEGSLQQKEKEDLRTLSLTDPPVEEEVSFIKKLLHLAVLGLNYVYYYNFIKMYKNYIYYRILEILKAFYIKIYKKTIKSDLCNVI